MLFKSLVIHVVQLSIAGGLSDELPFDLDIGRGLELFNKALEGDQLFSSKFRWCHIASVKSLQLSLPRSVCLLTSELGYPHPGSYIAITQI